MMKNRVVAIGDFDGVHRGHQAVLQALCAWAKELDAEPIALSFDQNTKDRQVITGLQTKEYYIRQCGIETLVFLCFEGWKDTAPEEFVREFLIKELGVVGVLSGGDLHFGKDRAGNEFTLLSAGIAVKKAEDLLEGTQKISSTAIRQWLAQGDLIKAEAALGHPFTLMGEVCHGKGLARQYDLPTVNIGLEKNQLLPPFGVYAARVFEGDRCWPAVANIGLRPTVEQTDAPNLEAHLLEEAPDLYGATLRVDLVKFLRPERKFESEEELFLQIKIDGEKSKEVLSQ